MAANFKGMTTEPIGLAMRLVARERMVREIQDGLDAEECRFLLSLVAGKPEWSLTQVNVGKCRPIYNPLTPDSPMPNNQQQVVVRNVITLNTERQDWINGALTRRNVKITARQNDVQRHLATSSDIALQMA